MEERNTAWREPSYDGLCNYAQKLSSCFGLDAPPAAERSVIPASCCLAPSPPAGSRCSIVTSGEVLRRRGTGGETLRRRFYLRGGLDLTGSEDDFMISSSSSERRCKCLSKNPSPSSPGADGSSEPV
ncbi:Hypothetical predicted protein [Xyrichtys novacula]|uniref:Uncharacterized protein n=1 Tax=Xyrichtys novacula TaxID=13765 RepID=A0AAV1G1N2_XYRNO|nr:Hypothetical predicted protein [Xyrichtys novacula]